MIDIHQFGQYKLTKSNYKNKLLCLGKDCFLWRGSQEAGEIIKAEYNPHHTDHVLSEGRYRIYIVKDEPTLSDLIHLELEVNKDEWQGYLLPTGLPTDNKTETCIVPTREKITKNNLYKKIKKPFQKPSFNTI